MSYQAPRSGLAEPPLDLDIGVIYTFERQFMDQLIPSLVASSGSLRARLILVDNASTEGVAVWRPDSTPSIVLRNPSRLTYAENLNRILATATARYVLLLNTDMLFPPDQRCLERMVSFLDENSNCGIAGCRLLHEDGSDGFPARRLQTISTVLARRCGLGRFLRRTVDSYFYRENEPTASFACDWLSGCFLMVRHTAFQQVGGFDTRFRKYFEDVDFCLRMRLAGWQVMYHGATYGYHLEQRASKRLFSRDAWLHAQSYLRWLMKWGFHPRAETQAVKRLRKAA